MFRDLNLQKYAKHCPNGKGMDLNNPKIRNIYYTYIQISYVFDTYVNYNDVVYICNIMKFIFYVMKLYMNHMPYHMQRM